MGNKKNWDADAMKGTLISDMENEVMEGIRKTNTEQRISDGFQEIAEEQGGEKHQPSAINPQTSSVSPQPSEKEPTKGVQTYIPMSMYRRLNDIKLTRRENIAALVAQAIALWLDVQDGKQKVEKL